MYLGCGELAAPLSRTAVDIVEAAEVKERREEAKKRIEHLREPRTCHLYAM
jgi:hypothetical protein